MMGYEKVINEWLSDNIDENIKREVNKIVESNNDELIEEYFGHSLKFGTGGMRGKIGPGPARMNIYSVAKATEGIANYLDKLNKQELKAAVSYDTRHFSKEFAEIVSGVFAKHGIEVFIYEEPTPTPLLSYAVRYFNADVGVMITASHNPPEYNGYKVYDETGCQITSPVDEEIINSVNEVKNISEIERISFEKGIEDSIIKLIDSNIYEDYIKGIEDKLDIEEIINSDLRILYTPLHGTGVYGMKKIEDYYNTSLVDYQKEQIVSDPDFSTLELPNPEEKQAFSLALKQKNNYDMILATDPDADRVGVYFCEEDYFPNGNEIGTALLYYLLEIRSYVNGFVCNTIVTTDLQEEICKSFDIEVYRVLTGFKYIGEKMNNLGNYIFGCEESYGYLFNSNVRDKDAISACLLLIEFGTYLKKEGLGFKDFIDNIYKEYGYYLNDLQSIKFEGLSGQKEISNIIGKVKTISDKDLTVGNIIKTIDYNKDDTGLPKSDVIQIIGSNFKITVRPSGTEPKIKFYYQVNSKKSEESKKLLKELKNEFNKFINI